MSESPGIPLPQWQCHKKVYADRIEAISMNPEDYFPRWKLACGAIITAKLDLTARASPQVGDYYVRYDDGYEYWSPAKAFEESYTRIP